MSVGDVRASVEQLVSTWRRAPLVEVIATIDAAPELVRRVDRERRASGTGAAQAAVHEGVIYIVADRVQGHADLAASMLHEAVGHWGLRRTFGPTLSSLLDELAERNPGQVRKAAHAAGLDPSSEAHRRLAAEEVLASLAERDPKRGWGRRAVVAVRGWLRDHIPVLHRMPYSDAELVGRFIAPAWAHVLGRDAAPLLQRAAAGLTRQFAKWFGRSRAVDAEGSPLEMYCASPVTANVAVNGGRHPGFHSSPLQSAGIQLSRSPVMADDGTIALPVFARIERPKPLHTSEYDDMQAHFKAGDWRAYKRALIGAGYDGLVVRGDPEYTAAKGRPGGLDDFYVAFSAAQVRTALEDITPFRRAAAVFVSELVLQVQEAPMRRAPAQAWAAYLDSLVRSGAVKADEIEWTGVRDWLQLQSGRVAKEDVESFVSANGLVLSETIFDDGPADEELGWTLNVEHSGSLPTTAPPTRATRYREFSVRGGERYREVLLHLPEHGLTEIPRRAVWAAYDEGTYAGESTNEHQVDRWRADGYQLVERTEVDPAARIRGLRAAGNYCTAHWSQANVVAHIRLSDHVSGDGKSVLLVEEIQSDWAQEGRRRGFVPAASPDEPMVATRSPHTVVWDVRTTSGRFIANVTPSDVLGTDAMGSGDYRQITADEAIGAARRLLREAPHRAGLLSEVPPGPYVGSTDKWVALAIRRIVKLACDEGYEQVAFISGDQAVERFRLSTHVTHLRCTQNGDSTWDVWVPAKAPDGTWLEGSVCGDLEWNAVDRDKLDKLFGKEVAARIANGEGAAAEGDRLLSGLALRLGGAGMRAFYDRIVPGVAQDVLRRLGGPPLTEITSRSAYKVWMGDVQDYMGKEFFDEADAQRVALALGGEVHRIDAGAQKNVGFDITEDLRATASSGVPLFRRCPRTDLQQTPDALAIQRLRLVGGDHATAEP